MERSPTTTKTGCRLKGTAFVLILLLGLYCRSAGLFRDLDKGLSFHPDEPKQVVALHNFLENRYVWYNHNLYYDGYPLFLNHLDEWIIRPVRAVQRLVHHHVHPTQPLEPWPDTTGKYYWARMLRVLYGMIVVCLAYVLTRKLGMKTGWALAAMLLAAIAPLSSAVAHAATGDIGVDLFSALTLLCLTLFYRRPRLCWMLPVGLLTGFAFAAKYQGALLVLLPVISFPLYLWIGRRPVRDLLYAALLTALGAITGIFIAIPQLLFAFDRSWRLIRDNFIFIANYGVDPEFLAQPFIQKAVFSYTHNPPVLGYALGWSIVLSGAAGALLAIVQFGRHCTREDTPAARLRLWRLTVFLFPFVTALIALSGKPAVLTVHFAWLELPLILAAAWLLHTLWSARRLPLRVLALAAVLGMLGELGSKTMNELYYWQRPEIKVLASAYHEQIFKKGHRPEPRRAHAANTDTLRRLHVESSRIPVFRNRAINMESGNAALWTAMHVPPVPTIPGPLNSHWIFMEGPVFPRNDRCVPIPARGHAAYTLVFSNAPGPVTLGLRTGYRPARVALTMGGVSTSVWMSPQQQTQRSIQPVSWKHVAPYADHSESAWLVPLHAASDLGTVQMTVMTDPRATAHFGFFGGRATDLILPGTFSLHDMGAAVEQTLYRHGSTRRTLSAVSNAPFPAACTLTDDEWFLPAGIYRLDLSAEGFHDHNAMTLQITDQAGISDYHDTARTFRIGHGYTNLHWTFEKPFAPYECRIRITAVKGRITLHEWTLRPDTKAVLRAIHRHRAGAKRPAWQAPHPDFPPPPAISVTNVLFERGFHLQQLRFPDDIAAQQPFDVWPVFDPATLPARNFEEYYLFFHVVTTNRQRVAVVDVPMIRASFDPNEGHPVRCILEKPVPPGLYQVYAGIWNGRTEQRLDILSAPENHRVWHSKVCVGEIRIQDTP